MSAKQVKKKMTNSPEKVKIKTEKLDSTIYTMEHYVGDPVELIKQVFSTLNPKTIKNLAPESLKECKVEEIQELCFNELLGISSKRLKSIINATKCPTDTESSSDDDIQNIDEHISLEEISSDSDNEKNMDKKLEKNKNGKINPEAKTKGTNSKEMSVLELLELQARARAIRSQLALEPIAKIEVDSDDSNTDVRTTKSNPQQENYNKNSNNKSDQSTSIQIGEKRKEENNIIVNGNGSQTTENRPKKIKLKRNFRKRSIDTNSTNQVNSNTLDNKLPTTEQNIEMVNIKSPENKQLAERSPSPEVLPIVPNYETLCISDSDDDNVIKEKQDDISETVEKRKDEENPGKITNDNKNNDISIEKLEEKAREDFEDGEIIDNNTKKLNIDDENNDSIKIIDNISDKSDYDNKLQTENDVSQNNKLTSKIVESTKEIDLNDDDDHNDDIISLGDDDFYEMHDPAEENEEKCKIIPKIERKSPQKNYELVDFIELHDSGDDNDPTENQGQSWNTRWLQSKKVSKIMAESRLVNRVRDKRKKSKKAQQEQQLNLQQQLKEVESVKKQIEPKLKNDFKTFYEDGSLQQYKEIVHRDKKTE